MNSASVGLANTLCVRDYIDQHAETRPAEAFLIDPLSGKHYTFAECKEEIVAIVSQLSALGLKQGDGIAFAFSNSVQGALGILAILYGGYLATAINLVAGRDTIAYVLDHSEVKLAIVDEEGAQLTEQASRLNGARVKMVFLKNLITNSRAAFNETETVSANQDGLLMYTSGTTGRPKGVVHTQESLLCGGKNTAVAHALTEQDRGLCVLPFYHINAFCVSLMGSLVSGGSLVVPKKFSVSSFWKIIQSFKCSWFSVVPTQISYLLHDTETKIQANEDLHHLRFGRSASAPLSPEVHEAFESRFNVPIIETMGLTETAAQILSNPAPPGKRKIGSPGIAIGNEIMIADQNQKEIRNGAEGEILVRGPNVLRCYLKNKEATAQAITPDGWLRTGDLGRMDEEGYVFVTGRLKELIIKGGENIAPREVDEALYSHPDVIEAAAFAVACSNYGQTVEACVKLRENSKLTPEKLIEICQEKLGIFKAPDSIHFLEDLPKGPSGKIQRIKLLDMISTPAKP
ncbi:MAG: AMP-binding protein [Pseudomonadota bacterium]